MFKTLKEKLSLVTVASALLEVEFKNVGERNFEPEDKTCPFCSHKDCFRIKEVEGETKDSFYKCFSCSESGDVVTLTSKIKGITLVEAGKLLAKAYDIVLPVHTVSPIQEVFNLAAEYYHAALKTSGPTMETNGITPFQYQAKVRGHKDLGLDEFKVGWSDGGLIRYLNGIGIAEELLNASGLVSKKGKDFLPTNCFIYPHYVGGQVSHFTQKDPWKKIQYQLPSKYKLNGHQFYNSDSIGKGDPVIVVEGENDAISVFESDWEYGVICCNGSISGAQLDWMAEHLKGREVVTIFDNDSAGDGYREKTAKISKAFKKLTQIKLTGAVKDIDEYLVKGGNLEGLIRSEEAKNAVLAAGSEGSTTPILVEGEEEVLAGGSVIVKNNCYYKVRYKDGNESHLKLTNFVMQLHNVYIRDDQREREIKFTREDGKTSDFVRISSDAKVSLKPFKTLAANSIDGAFYGKEEDLNGIWDYVYKHGDEKEVYLPDRVGRLGEFNGWLFGDCFLSDSGAVYRPDKNGVIWPASTSVGIKPLSLVSTFRGEAEGRGVPRIYSELEEEERVNLIGDFIDRFGKNIDSYGDALTAVAWMWATIYSDIIFDITGNFPMLFFHGNKGRGKSTLMKYLLDFYGVRNYTFSTVANLNSGASWTRKMGYYASLPCVVDEIRKDGVTAEWVETFRTWFDRVPKTLANRDNNGIKEQFTRATFIFGGQDLFEDPATRSRFVVIRVPDLRGEKVDTFQWFEENSAKFSAIGYHFIKNFGLINPETLAREISELRKVLISTGVESRIIGIWSVIGVFIARLARVYNPEFNFIEFINQAAIKESKAQSEEDTLTVFWEAIEGMQAQENSRVKSEVHFKVGDKDELWLWYPPVYNEYVGMFGRNESLPKFSKNAMLHLIQETPYFKCMRKVIMSRVQRRVVVLDLTKAPQSVINIAEFTK